MRRSATKRASRIPARIPKFLYRAMEMESHARAFVEKGIIRLNSLDYYRTAEGAKGDPDEGSAEYQEPLPGRPDEFVPFRNEIFNSIFLLFMSDPRVERS